jgi:transcriptional regulator with XRE-family HTH domain
MGDGDDKDRGVIAERLDSLFASVTPKGRPYSLREVADGINSAAGRTVTSHQYLSQIREGKRRKPSLEVLEAIARWFGVKTAYFLDDEVAERTEEELRAIGLLRDAGVRSVAFRAAGLAETDLDLVVTILDQMRDKKGLPPAEPDDTRESPPGAGPKFLPPA